MPLLDAQADAGLSWQPGNLSASNLRAFADSNLHVPVLLLRFRAVVVFRVDAGGGRAAKRLEAAAARR